MPEFKVYRWTVNGIMFYWDVFNMKDEKYGGHGHWIGRRLGRLILLDYLSFVFSPKSWKWGHFYTWYDGPHNSLSMGPFTIAWGGPPDEEA